MNVLVLSPHPEKLADILAASNDHPVAQELPISTDTPDPDAFGFAVSYGCRHIVDAAAVQVWQHRLINLHISLLPWNRGADPNFWAACDGTPGGVSIHHIDAGIDTGDLIAQAEVPFQPQDTLATSYARLHRRILDLFAEVWPRIRSGTAPRRPQPAGGSYHRTRDKGDLMARLPLGWHTPIADIARLHEARLPQ